MKHLKLYLTVLVSSLFFLNAAYSGVSKMSPEDKLSQEITLLLDDADYLNLKGQSIETTLVFLVDENNRLNVIDSGTDHEKLNKYIKGKLDNKRIWTKNLEQDIYYYLTVRFEPGK